MSINDIAQLTATLIAAGGLYFAFWSFRKSMFANVMMAYSDRFSKVMEKLPAEILRKDCRSCDLPPQDPHLRLICVQYFNLTLEEFYLAKKGYFPRDLWRIWEVDIKRLLAHPLMVREWRDVQGEFDIFPEFYSFVIAVQDGELQAPLLDAPSS